jgi:hypothetical protein
MLCSASKGQFRTRKESEQVTASHPGKHRERDKSGCGKEVVDKEHSRPGGQRYRQVTTWKRSKREGGTHSLEGTERETSQNNEGKHANKEHTIWRYKQRKNEDTRREQVNKGERTNWKAQKVGQVRTQEEREKVRGTHSLENAEGGGSGLENQSELGHSLPREHRRKEKSEDRNEASNERGILTA